MLMQNICAGNFQKLKKGHVSETIGICAHLILKNFKNIVKFIDFGTFLNLPGVCKQYDFNSSNNLK